jgi:hypothetical protein
LNVENFCSYSEVNLLHAVHFSYDVFSTPHPLKLKCIKGEVLPKTLYEDTLALDGGGGCLVPLRGCCTPGSISSTHMTGGWVGFDEEEVSCLLW